MSSSSESREFHLGAGKANQIASAYRNSGEVFRILDLGCGPGNYHEDMKRKLKQIGPGKEIEIIGVDNNYDALERAGQGNYILHDVTSEYDLPVEEDSIDLVYSRHLSCQLTHEETQEIIEKAEKVLEDSGVQFHEC